MNAFQRASTDGDFGVSRKAVQRAVSVLVGGSLCSAARGNKFLTQLYMKFDNFISIGTRPEIPIFDTDLVV